jgi:DNA-directed RNA polymerase specialized sigma24 family protein
LNGLIVTPRRDPSDEPRDRLADLGKAAILGARSARPRDAEDAAQDPLLGLAETGNLIDSSETLARIAGRRRAIDLGRKWSRRRDHLTRTGVQPTDTPDGVAVENEALARVQARELLAFARDHLTPHEFEAVVALYEAGGTVNDAVRLLAKQRPGRSRVRWGDPPVRSNQRPADGTTYVRHG